jgi:hypothetical protein
VWRTRRLCSGWEAPGVVREGGRWGRDQAGPPDEDRSHRSSTDSAAMEETGLLLSRAGGLAAERTRTTKLGGV